MVQRQRFLPAASILSLHITTKPNTRTNERVKKRPRLSSPKREIDKAESTFSFSEKKVSTYTFSLYNPLSGILENEFKKNEMNMATAEVTAIL